ncbi:hypothetical protein BC938DRAFT_484100 [Jimgerdemannia flammicorona]|uniref:Uncharacterized protein n=1 Tax=Jimgerdemannia flammicorona TaxID=994334 RepID=A0A433QAL1_9FUNG|nr:hypothetical protein BC938DRAFT_484100 [Jimgerdemannia flammicorona]
MCIPSTFCAFLLDIQIVMSTKLTLVLCACFFAFGTYWADWSIDYWLIWADPALNPNAIPNAITYYQNLYNAPQIHKIVLLAPVFIGVVGLSMGFAQMYDINFLFDGGALGLYSLLLRTLRISCIYTGAPFNNDCAYVACTPTALLLFVIQTHAGTVVPAMKIIATSEVEPEVVRKLYEIAAGHTLIVFAVVGTIYAF